METTIVNSNDSASYVIDYERKFHTGNPPNMIAVDFEGTLWGTNEYHEIYKLTREASHWTRVLESWESILEGRGTLYDLKSWNIPTIPNSASDDEDDDGYIYF